MIKRIYHIADVHIPTYKRIGMYEEQTERLINSIKDDAIKNNLSKDDMRIVICGDLVHQKNDVSNELNVFVSSFIRKLSEIAKVLCIAGNHDLVINNGNRTDTLTAIFKTALFENALFLDYELDCKSGVIYDDNITWAVYSFYDDFRRPDLDKAKEEKPENKIIGLYHGQVVGIKLFNGTAADSGQDSSIFNGCDCVLAGHIHKRQEVCCGTCKLVYSGSLLQNSFGESVSQHGYVIWDVDTLEYQFIDIPSDYGYYDITIDSVEDIIENKEIFNNQ